MTTWGVLLAISFLALSYVSQINYDSWSRYSQRALPVSYNDFIEPQPLSGDSAKSASLGQSQFMANIYWLELIQYYGGGEPNGRYRKLPDLYNSITDLDPKFVLAYQNGLLILPGEGFVNEAIALGKKGEESLPNSWEIPYYLGLDYHIYKKDYVSAAIEFTKAAKLPGAPANTAYFAALYYSQTDQRQVSYQLFKSLAETETDPYLKDRAEKYAEQLAITFNLEDIIAKFKQKYQHFPTSLQELVDKKIITAVPVSPLGFTFNYDSTSGQIKQGK